MTIAYIANIRLPTEKAYGYQTMRVCHEWAKLGHQVTIYIPDRTNPISEDAFEFYGLERNFTVVYVPCTNWMRLVRVFGKFAFMAQSLSFLQKVSSRIVPGSIIFTLDPEAVRYLSARGFVCFYNAHNWPRHSRLAAWLIAPARGVVCNSSGTEAAVRLATGLQTVIAHNATDPNPFAGKDSAALRSELGLPLQKRIILYSGHLYGWKGIEVLLQTAESCRTHAELQFVAIGGTKQDIERVQQKVPGNIAFLGHKKRSLVPKYLAAADVLLLPNTKGTEESIRYTSPMKLFEYLASGVPVVASDLPSIRDIVTDDQVFFAEAGNASSFAEAIMHVMHNPMQAQQKAVAALKASAQYTWDMHAKRVAEFMHSRISH